VSHHPTGWKAFGIALLAALAGTAPGRAQLGIVISGVGPVNRSMGGASTAAPIDAAGATYWNPASITGLGRSEMEFGVAFLYPISTLSSSVPAGALGPFTPPVPLSGSTHSEDGMFPLPSFGLVVQPEDSSWTFGMGVYEVGGFAANYSASTANPILTPQPPRGIGVGPLFSELQVFQLAPTVAARLTDHLSVGVAPTLSMATLRVDPFLIGTPDVLAPGVLNYETGTHTRLAFGGGFQAGVYLTTDAGWNLGASAKSPQWFEPARYKAVNVAGLPVTNTFHADYPMILSLGTAYTGFERWVLAADVRYVDYRNTKGFRQGGFDPTGALRGLGWDSIVAVALGAQYQWSEALSLRAGYTYNDNPVTNSASGFNIASPVIVQHSLAVGFSYRATDALAFSVAYTHDFENSIDGPLQTPRGAVPGTSVKNAVAADSLVIGATVRFGGCKN
jgi:long-chain fatty acid transport protein